MHQEFPMWTNIFQEIVQKMHILKKRSPSSLGLFFMCFWPVNAPEHKNFQIQAEKIHKNCSFKTNWCNLACFLGHICHFRSFQRFFADFGLFRVILRHSVVVSARGAWPHDLCICVPDPPKVDLCTLESDWGQAPLGIPPPGSWPLGLPRQLGPSEVGTHLSTN